MKNSDNVICSKKCGICDGGKEVAKINSNFICNNITCGEKYCSNAVEIENITNCMICKKGKVIENQSLNKPIEIEVNI